MVDSIRSLSMREMLSIFQIVNFPELSEKNPNKRMYGVFVSLTIRYTPCREDIADFSTRFQTLIKNAVVSDLRKCSIGFPATHRDILFHQI